MKNYKFLQFPIPIRDKELRIGVDDRPRGAADAKTTAVSMVSRIFSLLLAGALAGGVYLWVTNGPNAAATQERAVSAETASVAAEAAERATPVRVLAATSVARPLAENIVLRGVSEAARKVEVSAQTEGLVSSDPLPRGAAVRAGDHLCEIEIGDRAARLAEAQARLAQAQTDADASSSLNERGFRAETQLAADAADLESAKAAVALIEIDIARTRIVAPFDGRLETDAAERGALLRSGSRCATLIALDPIRFVGYAPERAIDAIDIGAEATVRFVSGAEIAASVSFVSRSADPETRTFRVEAMAPNADERVRDGMTTEIEIPLDAAPAHRLPHSALTLDDAGRLGVRTVEPRDGGGAVAGFVEVEIFRDGPQGVWLGGLPDRADVILVGQEYVRAGAPIDARYVDIETALSDGGPAAAAAATPTDGDAD